MSALYDRLKYVLERHTVYSVAQDTGIPYSSLYRMSQGGGDVRPEYRSALRNYYQREAYSRMRDEGFNTRTARAFSWRTPDTVRDATQKLITDRNTMAEMVTRARLARDNETVTPANWKEYYIEAWNDIYSAFKKSQYEPDKFFERY